MTLFCKISAMIFMTTLKIYLASETETNNSLDVQAESESEYSMASKNSSKSEVESVKINDTDKTINDKESVESELNLLQKDDSIDSSDSFISANTEYIPDEISNTTLEPISVIHKRPLNENGIQNNSTNDSSFESESNEYFLAEASSEIDEEETVQDNAYADEVRFRYKSQRVRFYVLIENIREPFDFYEIVQINSLEKVIFDHVVMQNNVAFMENVNLSRYYNNYTKSYIHFVIPHVRIDISIHRFIEQKDIGVQQSVEQIIEYLSKLYNGTYADRLIINHSIGECFFKICQPQYCYSFRVDRFYSNSYFLVNPNDIESLNVKYGYVFFDKGFLLFNDIQANSVFYVLWNDKYGYYFYQNNHYYLNVLPEVITTFMKLTDLMISLDNRNNFFVKWPLLLAIGSLEQIYKPCTQTNFAKNMEAKPLKIENSVIDSIIKYVRMIDEIKYLFKCLKCPVIDLSSRNHKPKAEISSDTTKPLMEISIGVPNVNEVDLNIQKKDNNIKKKILYVALSSFAVIIVAVISFYFIKKFVNKETEPEKIQIE